MTELILAFTGLMAAGGSYLTMRDMDPSTGMIISMWSMLWWGAFAFQASNVRVLSNGTEFTYQLDSLFYLGLASALIMLLFTFSAAMSVFRDQAGATEDMSI